MVNSAGLAFYTYLSRFLEYINTEISFIPLIISIWALTAVIFPPFIGKYSDRIQNRSIFLTIGSIGIAFSVLVLVFFTDLWIIILIVFSYGFFAALGSMIFVLYAETVENDEKYISYYNAGIALGWFLGAILGGLYIDLFGITSIFQFILFFAILNVLSVLFIKEDRDKILERSIQLKREREIANLVSKGEDINPLSNTIYPALFFRNFCVRSVLSILPIIMAIHIKSETEIGFIIGFNPLLQLALIILVGRIVNKKNMKMLMVIGYLLSAFAVFGYIISVDFWGFLMCQILISISYSLFWTATWVYIAQNTTPENKGKYSSYASTSFYLGSFAGSLLFSSLIAFYGNYYTAIYFMILFPVLSAIIILFQFKFEPSQE